MTRYYIDIGTGKDGPHDLVIIMRRIRAKKLLPGMLIYSDDAESPLPAKDIPEIAPFFTQDTQQPENEATVPSLPKLLEAGWRFVLEHNTMTVYAGVLMIVCMIMAIMLVKAFSVAGGVAAWVLFIIMHNIYLLFALRLHRGQTLSSHFVQRQLAPVLPALLLASIALALMMAGGLVLLIIPAAWVAASYIFVPFLLADHGGGVMQSKRASRALLQKNNYRYLPVVMLLLVLHLLCLLLIVPIPITLPVFAAVLAEIYEELVAL